MEIVNIGHSHRVFDVGAQAREAASACIRDRSHNLVIQKKLEFRNCTNIIEVDFSYGEGYADGTCNHARKGCAWHGERIGGDLRLLGDCFFTIPILQVVDIRYFEGIGGSAIEIFKGSLLRCARDQRFACANQLNCTHRAEAFRIVLRDCKGDGGLRFRQIGDLKIRCRMCKRCELEINAFVLSFVLVLSDHLIGRVREKISDLRVARMQAADKRIFLIKLQCSNSILRAVRIPKILEGDAVPTDRNIVKKHDGLCVEGILIKHVHAKAIT